MKPEHDLSWLIILATMIIFLLYVSIIATLHTPPPTYEEQLRQGYREQLFLMECYSHHSESYCQDMRDAYFMLH